MLEFFAHLQKEPDAYKANTAPQKCDDIGPYLRDGGSPVIETLVMVARVGLHEIYDHLGRGQYLGYWICTSPSLYRLLGL